MSLNYSQKYLILDRDSLCVYVRFTAHLSNR